METSKAHGNAGEMKGDFGKYRDDDTAVAFTMEEASPALDWQPVLRTDRARRPADRVPMQHTSRDEGLVAIGFGFVGSLIGLFVMLLGGYGTI